MTQIEDIVPLSKYERQKLLNDSVKAPNDFSCTDEEFFANNGRLVRLRPPRSGEADGKAASLKMIGLEPMVVLVRSSMEAKPRPVALIAFDAEAHSRLPMDLLRMGDEGTLDLLRGSSNVLFSAQLRWWPL